MKKALFIVEKFYPEENANTVCLDKIREYMISRGYKVDIFCKRDYEKDQKDKAIECGTIFYIDNYFQPTIKRLKRIGFDYYKVSSIIRLPIKWYCQYKTVLLGYKKYKRLALKEDKIEHYNIILSFSMPFDMHSIAKRMKKSLSDSKWVAYMFDPFVYNYTMSKSRADTRKKYQEKTFKTADKVFLTRGIMEENARQNYYPSFLDKIVEVDLPNLSEYKSDEVKNHNNCLLFVGGFYSDIRNPQKMFEVLEKLNIHDTKIKLIGYGCEDLVKNFQRRQSDKVFVTGKLPHNKCIQEINDASILLNLGNTIPNQTPSKVFEYISMGKPVINFYELENDTSLFYFAKYPLAFNFNLNKYSDDDIIKLENFIIANAGKRISFDEAVINLQEYTGKNVCKKIFTIVEEII